MGLVSIVALCALVVMANAEEQRSFELEQAPNLFSKFMKDHNRTYKDDEDRDIHYKAFVENLKKINELNKQNPMTVFGINKFADYTEEESHAMFGLRTKKSELSPEYLFQIGNSTTSSSTIRHNPQLGINLSLIMPFAIVLRKYLILT